MNRLGKPCRLSCPCRSAGGKATRARNRKAMTQSKQLAEPNSGALPPEMGAMRVDAAHVRAGESLSDSVPSEQAAGELVELESSPATTAQQMRMQATQLA